MPDELRLRVPVDLVRELDAVTSLMLDDRWCIARHRHMSVYLPDGDPVPRAGMTAAASHRELIYVSAAHHGGAALRVPASGEPRIESIELPDLNFSVCAVAARSRYEIWVAADPAGSHSAS